MAKEFLEARYEELRKEFCAKLGKALDDRRNSGLSLDAILTDVMRDLPDNICEALAHDKVGRFLLAAKLPHKARDRS